jgi:hypothetical protein
MAGKSLSINSNNNNLLLQGYSRFDDDEWLILF